ncbi:MAG: radical SAM protein [FCB group bacterium]|nr:radical SAM protein [FCB group bacterium]
MKILLIRPHSDVPAAPPPIGLMYLAGYVRKYGPGHEIMVHDGRVKQTPVEQMRRLIADAKPDIIGITAFSMESEQAHAVAGFAKELFPQVPVVLGGPYASSDRELAGADKNIDVIVFGEGEITFNAILNAYEKNDSLESVKGIQYRSNGSVHSTGPAEVVENPDDIPFPAWDLIDLEDYFRPSAGKRRLTNPIQMRERGMSVFSSRGCPYQCTYCHNIFGKKLRKRSAENVIQELKWLKKDFRVGEIEFIDDVFNLDRDRAKSIMDMMVYNDLDLKFSYPNGLRADQMDEELILKMKKAGCYRINYAVESGSDRIQKKIKKRLNLPRTKEIIDFTAKQGISVGGFFMLGFPDETEQEMQMTIDFALKSKCHTASFFILTPFPGTEMYDEALEAGFDMETLFSDYGHVSANLSRNVTSERIEKLRQKAFRKFYFNPRRMVSIFNTTPNKSALMRNVVRTAKLSFLGKEY